MRQNYKAWLRPGIICHNSPPEPMGEDSWMKLGFCWLGLTALCFSLVRGYFLPRGTLGSQRLLPIPRGCWVSGGRYLVMSEAIFGSHSRVERSYWHLGCCSVKVPRLRNLPLKIWEGSMMNWKNKTAFMKVKWFLHNFLNICNSYL